MASKRKRKPQRERRTFSEEFKADAVELVRQSTKSIAEIARDLDLSETALRNWVKRAEIDAGGGQTGPLTADEREELRQLRRENRELRMERDFLKKTSAYFAKDSRRSL